MDASASHFMDSAAKQLLKHLGIRIDNRVKMFQNPNKKEWLTNYQLKTGFVKNEILFSIHTGGVMPVIKTW